MTYLRSLAFGEQQGSRRNMRRNADNQQPNSVVSENRIQINAAYHKHNVDDKMYACGNVTPCYFAAKKIRWKGYDRRQDRQQQIVSYK